MLQIYHFVVYQTLNQFKLCVIWFISSLFYKDVFIRIKILIMRHFLLTFRILMGHSLTFFVRFWLYCTGHFTLLFLNTFKLFGFPIFWLVAYLMKGSQKTQSCALNFVLCFDIYTIFARYLQVELTLFNKSISLLFVRPLIISN